MNRALLNPQVQKLCRKVATLYTQDQRPPKELGEMVFDWAFDNYPINELYQQLWDFCEELGAENEE